MKCVDFTSRYNLFSVPFLSSRELKSYSITLLGLSTFPDLARSIEIALGYRDVGGRWIGKRPGTRANPIILNPFVPEAR